jgi:hypothetical protein
VIAAIRPDLVPAGSVALGVRVWFYRRADGQGWNSQAGNSQGAGGQGASSGGLSWAHERATITALVPVDPLTGVRGLQPLPVSGGATPTVEAPAVWLVRDVLVGSRQAFLVLTSLSLLDGVPLLEAARFGGNFAYSTDPVYARLLGWSGAVPVHDGDPGADR